MSLAGKRIVNTRAVHQAEEFDDLLRAEGAMPLDYPCIAIVPPEDTTELDQALREDFDLLILTSANTVMMLAQRLRTLGLSLDGMKAAAVGAATAEAARDLLGVEIGVIPESYSASALADTVVVAPGMRVLLPLSVIAGRDLFSSLMLQGADVSLVTAYRTIRGSGGVELAPLFKRQEVDAVTVTSSSTARFFVERLEIEGASKADLGGVCIASIGAQTSKTIHELGLQMTVEAEKHTLAGLIEGLAAHFGEPL